MSPPVSEREMVWQAVKSLTDAGLEVAVEVPLMNRSIDLVVRDQNDRMVAIEFKRHDWRRALTQAKDHQLGTTEVFICLPRNIIHEKIVEEAATIGVGVYSWSESNPLELHLEPDLGSFPIDGVREWLVEAFETRKKQGAKL